MKRPHPANGHVLIARGWPAGTPASARATLRAARTGEPHRQRLTEHVAARVLRSGMRTGVAYLTRPPGPFFIRIAESEGGRFDDLGGLLEQLVPNEDNRERVLCLLLGPRGDQVPFRDRTPSLGRWQRVLSLGLGAESNDCTVTLIGR